MVLFDRDKANVVETHLRMAYTASSKNWQQVQKYTN